MLDKKCLCGSVCVKGETKNMKKQKTDKIYKPTCPRCSSTQTLFRITKKMNVCRICGFEFVAVKRILAG